MIETGFEQLFIWTSGNVRFPGLHQITFYSCLSVCNVDKTVHTRIHVHRRKGTDTTYVRRKAWFPAKTSFLNLLAHGSVLVWTRFFQASESNEQYVSVCTCKCCSWLDPALLLVKNLSRRSHVLMAKQYRWNDTDKTVLTYEGAWLFREPHRYLLRIILHNIKYIHRNMNFAQVSWSRELVISKSTRKLDKGDSRRIETV